MELNLRSYFVTRDAATYGHRVCELLVDAAPSLTIKDTLSQMGIAPNTFIRVDQQTIAASKFTPQFLYRADQATHDERINMFFTAYLEHLERLLVTPPITNNLNNYTFSCMLRCALFGIQKAYIEIIKHFPEDGLMRRFCSALVGAAARMYDSDHDQTFEDSAARLGLLAMLCGGDVHAMASAAMLLCDESSPLYPSEPIDLYNIAGALRAITAEYGADAQIQMLVAQFHTYIPAIDAANVSP